MKKKWKSTLGGRGWPPIDEKTHKNQPKYSASDGGKLCDEMRPWQNVCGGEVTLFGAVNEAARKKNQFVAIGSRQTKKYTTIYQKHAGMTDGVSYKTQNLTEKWDGHDFIDSGAIELGGG